MAAAASLWLFLMMAAVILLAPAMAFSQTVEWSRRTGTIGMDESFGVAVDSSGVYTVGYAAGELPDLDTVGKQDAFIRKFDSAGNVLWTRQFGSVFHDAANAVAADLSGIYVAGNVGPQLADFTNANRLDGFLRKYSVNGDLQWSRQFTSIGTPQNDSAQAVAVTGNGVYIAGYTHGTLPGQNPEGGFDAFVRKYDLNGDELWTRQFGTKGTEVAVGIAANASGIYVLGETDRALPGQVYASGLFDVFLRKYDTNGTELWTRQFGTSGLEFPGGVAADASGVYIVGATSGALPGQSNTSGYDAFVRKYDTNGAELWTRQFGSTRDVLAYGVAASGSSLYITGNVIGFLPGQVGSGGFNEDVFVRKYDSSGAEQLTRQFGTAERDTAAAVAVNSTGIYVSGAVPRILLSPNTTGDWDGVLTKLVEAPALISAINGGEVVNAASLQPQVPVAAGSMASVFGIALPPAGQEPMVVQVNGIDAPAFAMSDSQINFQVPWQLAGLSQASLTVTVGESASSPVAVPLTAAAPGLFSTNASGSGQGAIVIADTAAVAAPVGAFSGSRPANRTESVAIYCTGLGAVINQPPTGVAASATSPSTTVEPASVTIGGVPATVSFAGLAPGFVGLYQVNVEVPEAAPSGSAVPVVLSIGGAASNTVTIAVE